MNNSASNVNEYLENIPGWQQANLIMFRKLVQKTYPNITEEIKWCVPTFTQNGAILFAMSSFKKHTKFNFIHNGASLSDDNNLFNNGLDSKKSRSIDLREGETIDEQELLKLLKQAGSMLQ